MKKKIILATLIAFGSINMASAKFKVPVCFPCETMETTLELPEDSEINELADQKLNLSYINTEYGMLWISVWNTEGRYVLSDETNEAYFEIEDDVAKILKEKHNFDISTAGSPLSFWKKIGGKLVILAIVSLFIWDKVRSKEKT